MLDCIGRHRRFHSAVQVHPALVEFQCQQHSFLGMLQPLRHHGFSHMHLVKSHVHNLTSPKQGLQLQTILDALGGNVMFALSHTTT
jgi:hypothetical protein